MSEEIETARRLLDRFADYFREFGELSTLWEALEMLSE